MLVNQKNVKYQFLWKAQQSLQRGSTDEDAELRKDVVELRLDARQTHLANHTSPLSGDENAGLKIKAPPPNIGRQYLLTLGV